MILRLFLLAIGVLTLSTAVWAWMVALDHQDAWNQVMPKDLIDWTIIVGFLFLMPAVGFAFVVGAFL